MRSLQSVPTTRQLLLSIERFRFGGFESAPLIPVESLLQIPHSGCSHEWLLKMWQGVLRSAEAFELHEREPMQPSIADWSARGLRRGLDGGCSFSVLTWPIRLHPTPETFRLRYAFARRDFRPERGLSPESALVAIFRNALNENWLPVEAGFV